MLGIVVDTNVIVSGFLSGKGPCAIILDMILAKDALFIHYDARILLEYEEVLSRPQFALAKERIDEFIQLVKIESPMVDAEPFDGNWVDDSDKKFYEVARSAKTLVITGNKKHFPQEGFIMSPREFWEALGE
jgi:putative PIN family toxin of toxin-antitoxin system